MKKTHNQGRHRLAITGALLLLMGIQAYARSYTIEFAKAENNTLGINLTNGYSTLAQIISQGEEYITGFGDITNVWYQHNYHLKLASSSEKGKLTINLSERGQIAPTTIIVVAKNHDQTKAATLKVNGKSHELSGDTFAEYTYTINATASITNLKLESNKYCYIQSITVNYESPASLTLPFGVVNGKSYATFCSSERHFNIPAGVKAYYVSGYTHENAAYTITMTEAADIKAGEGYVMIGNGANSYTFEEKTEGTALTENYLMGLTASKASDTFEDCDFIFAQNNGTVCFYAIDKSQGGSLAAGKAYLHLSDAQGVQSVGVRFGDETAVDILKREEDNAIYDLRGQKVDKMGKGIYIVRGKKVMVR